MITIKLNEKKILIIGIVVSLLISIVLFIIFKPKNKVFKDKNAKPEPVYYTIKFDSDGGTTISDIKVLENTKITLPKDPTKQGYIFANWYDEDDETVSNETIATKDMTLKAKWIEKEVPIFTVIFDTNGGNYVAPVKVAADENLKFPKDPVKEGYTFVTWVDENNEVIKDGVIVPRDMTIYAEWKETYICPAGFKKNGKTCIKTLDSIATPSCSEGELEPANNICLTGTVEALKDTICEDGFELSDNKCIASEGTELEEEEEECLDGYLLKEGVCYQINEPTEKEYCPENTLSVNGVCYEMKEAEFEYSCEKEGYEVDENDHSKCQKIIDATLN